MTDRDKERAIRIALEAATWAPSVHNSQPWSFSITGDEIAVRADPERRLRYGDATGRQQLISCGAALFNLVTTLRCQGYEPVTRVLPDPDRPSLLATVRAAGSADVDELTKALRAEVKRRRTHRAGFTDLPIPDRLIDALVAQAGREGARLTPVRSPVAVAVVAALTQAAQGVQSQDRVLNLEVIRWARPPGSSRADGVPADAYPAEPARTSPHFPQRDYAWRHEWGNPSDQSASASSGVLTLLTTSGDTREEWIACGKALQRTLLYASAHGVSAAFHTQALEMHHLREYLRQELCSGEYPQMIMRLGITFDDTSAVRRPLRDVLDQSLGCGR
ncbi:Acg family FMN-binding oxidoreductase [Nonomuraea sp. NPDC050536]|uniref:Acg family FMN-binding oxidoreductase n=1 Tax=Nonomuraea sp. NPDC050536 TaxID=3364366 RepID=UPI0037CC58E1